MRKEVYQEPTMLIVKLQHTQMLMTSGVNAMRSGYGTADEQTWGDAAAVKANNNTDVWDDDWSKQ